MSLMDSMPEGPGAHPLSLFMAYPPDLEGAIPDDEVIAEARASLTFHAGNALDIDWSTLTVRREDNPDVEATTHTRRVVVTVMATRVPVAS